MKSKTPRVSKWELNHIITTVENSMDDNLENCLDGLLDQACRHATDGRFQDDVCLYAMDTGSGL